MSLAAYASETNKGISMILQFPVFIYKYCNF